MPFIKIVVPTFVCILLAIGANLALCIHEDSLEIPSFVQEFKCGDTWHISYVDEFVEPQELCLLVAKR